MKIPVTFRRPGVSLSQPISGLSAKKNNNVLGCPMRRAHVQFMYFFIPFIKLVPFWLHNVLNFSKEMVPVGLYNMALRFA